MVEGRDTTYVGSLVSDLENLNRFASATLDGDKKTMLESFNKFSWDDKKVYEHLPKYCDLEDKDLIYVDKVFSHLCPNYSKVHSPTFNTMALWFKTRLHLQHQLSPFSLNENF
ncbi:conserved hypothetical protein [Theileria orientalis strain Shintoku]|uniref:ATPTG10-like domain-containing protein n=1 Tax=Theileria orientalis strain Shintoku TaxID=869250 RepID=J4CCB7_THEOR|nr:conserved hypothetical protein [Theileria orientalis strain Shintoku]PVC52840.1 hypothetical protein MACL_00000471 [Theileria orientalis]BAM39112.1 conserved hypothetical protein [Theileria orientalis strain Shintoku]|eukprot:XP_009689413.1 conserved hypothetical protein [Theileria orientalis strain Shintoku]